MQLALYRELRPRTFQEIVAQEHVTRTLLNAIRQGRLAHAYLFCGPRGTGKTSTARVLAKALNCARASEGAPCGECPACLAIAAGEGMDVIEMDAASNRGIEEIRSLRERVRLAPVAGRYKVYVVDEVHMLTNEAFNALLKTLEEPPANVIFILCTTEAYRVPPTILSRCQRFDFHRLPTAAIASHLGQVAEERGWAVEAPALGAMARAATGSMRDALGILDQCVAYSGGPVSLSVVRRVLGAVDPARLGALAGAVLARDTRAAWGALEELLDQGRDAREVARALAGHLRDVLLYRLAGPAGEPTGPLADDRETLAAHAARAAERELYEAIDCLAAAEAEMRLAPQPRLLLEAKLARLCGPGSGAGAAAGASAGTAAGAAAGATTDAERPAARPPQAAPPEQARPVSREGSGGLDAGQARRAYGAALAQLSDKDRGWLDGATPEWDGRVLWVWLPAGREELAAFLDGRETRRALVRGLGQVLGYEPEVRIRAKPPGPGLFGDGEPPVAGPEGRGRRAGAETDPVRLAQEMFGAEEVGKE